MKLNYKQENILSRMEQPGSAYQLACFRILLGLQIFYSSGSRLFQLSSYVGITDGTKNIFPAFLNRLIDSTAVPYVQMITMVLSIFLVMGLLTKYILPLLSLSFLFLFSFYYARNNAPNAWLYVWFPLLLLNFTRCSDVLSLDKLFRLLKSQSLSLSNAYRWPMEMVAAWFAYIYVAAGLAKLLPLYKGLHWMQGGTIQEIMYNRFLDSNYFYLFGRPLFDYTEHYWIFTLLSIVSILIEFMCILILFTNRYHGLIITLVVGMHFFLYLNGVLGFMQVALVLSISLLNPLFFEKLFNTSTLKTARV